MILKIAEMNTIFKEVFNQNRKVQLKFHESILKLISSKQNKALEYYLSVFINENLYKEKIRNKYILDKPFIQLLSNIEKKEIFSKYHKNYIIQRIAYHIFNLDIESNFYNYLKKNIAYRYLVDISKIFKDIN